MTTTATKTHLDAFAGNKVRIRDEITILKDGEDAPIVKGQVVWRVLSQKDGDSRLTWNRMNIGEINDAKEMFDEMVEQGLVPHCVGVDGAASAEVMSTFDPTAQEVIFMPVAAIIGG